MGNPDAIAADMQEASVSELLEWDCKIHEEIGMSEQGQQECSV
jgi:hypothetical protein